MARTYGNYSSLIDFTRASSGTALRPISYGDELVVNGDFSTDSDWTLGSGWTISDGIATHNGSYGSLEQDVTLEVGKIYKLNADTVYFSGGTLQLNFDAVVAQTLSATGVFNVIFVATAATTSVRFSAGSGVWSIDNISIKEVLFDQPNGTLTLFNHPNNIPRIEYDADGNLLGLLVEESRTNLITQSENFGASVWNTAAAGITVVSDAIAAPDGTMTADKLQENSSTDTHRRGFNFSSSNDKIFSFFAKAGERTKVRTWSFSSGNTAAVTFDLSNGTIVSGSNIGKEGKIEYYGNGWYRCSSKVFDGQTYVVVGPMIDGENGGNTGNYTGDGSSGVYVWGAQLEAGSFPTSYIPTSGSTATRSADVASIDVSEFGYNQSEGTVVVEQSIFDTALNAVVWQLDDGTKNNRSVFNALTANTTVLVNNTLQASLTHTPQSTNTFYKHGFAQSSNDFASVYDGGSAVTDSSGDLPVVSTLRFGRDHATEYLNGHIKSIKYYPRRLTNAQLQELTS